MQLLVVGQTGQLARAIADEVENSGFTAEFLDRHACELSASEETIQAIVSSKLEGSDAVIIAAAYTAVDAAEEDFDTALAVNAAAPGAIARAAKKAGIPVIHVSTDYVFSGDGTQPYTVETIIDPLNAYGRSKAIGERAVRTAQPRSAILRTSWVYDASGKNFLTTMLRLAETHEALGVVADQIGRPTYAPDLARATIQAAKYLIAGETAAEGIFHVSNTGDPISWADFARAIFTKAGTGTTVNDIPSSDYPTPAKRPVYSVLDTKNFEDVFAFDLPLWTDGLERAFQKRTGDGT